MSEGQSDYRFFAHCPIVIESSEGQGRYVVAKRDIKAGEQILRASPYTFSVTHDVKEIFCDGCLKQNKSSSRHLPFWCKVCKEVYYCSEECQEQSKVYHELECAIFRKFHTTAPPSETYGAFKMTIRALIRRACELQPSLFPENARCLFASDGLIYSDVETLVSHSSQFNSPLTYAYAEYISDIIDRRTKSSLNEDQIVELGCILDCNGFGLYVNNDMCVGDGLYPSASFFNHSCDPNVCKANQGKSLIFYALRDIRQGEEISVTYVDVELPRRKRQKLLQNYFFKCQCSRCVSNAEYDSKLLCPSPCCGFRIPIHSAGGEGEGDGAPVATGRFCSRCYKKSDL